MDIPYESDPKFQEELVRETNAWVLANPNKKPNAYVTASLKMTLASKWADAEDEAKAKAKEAEEKRLKEEEEKKRQEAEAEQKRRDEEKKRKDAEEKNRAELMAKNEARKAQTTQSDDGGTTAGEDGAQKAKRKKNKGKAKAGPSDRMEVDDPLAESDTSPQTEGPCCTRCAKLGIQCDLPQSIIDYCKAYQKAIAAGLKAPQLMRKVSCAECRKRNSKCDPVGFPSVPFSHPGKDHIILTRDELNEVVKQATTEMVKASLAQLVKDELHLGFQQMGSTNKDILDTLKMLTTAICEKLPEQEENAGSPKGDDEVTPRKKQPAGRESDDSSEEEEESDDEQPVGASTSQKTKDKQVAPSTKRPLASPESQRVPAKRRRGGNTRSQSQGPSGDEDEDDAMGTA